MAADPAPDLTQVPRARGAAQLGVKLWRGRSVLDDLWMSGALKLLFPANAGMEAVVLNTSGGLTGGDRFDLTARLAPGTHLTLTTQAAERAYRSAAGSAEVRNALSVGAGASLFWVPQETLLFDGSALRRSLRLDLAPTARLVMVEPLIFGRAAMGETVRQVLLDDRIEIRRDGAPLYTDHARLVGDAHARLACPAIGGGAGAMASVLYVSPDAEAQCRALRPLLPQTAGVSLLAPDTMVLRALADDGFALRQTLLPVLDRLTRNALPRCWRL